MKIYIVFDKETYYGDIGSIHSVWSSQELAQKYIAKFGDKTSLIEEFELDSGQEILDTNEFYYSVDLTDRNGKVAAKVGAKQYYVSAGPYIVQYHEWSKTKYFRVYVISTDCKSAKIKALEIYEQYRIKNQ